MGSRLTIIVLSLLVSACVSREYHQALIPDPERGIPNYHVEVGDRVQIQTKNGAEYEFDVTEITESAISGGDKKLEFSDIQKLEVRRVDTIGSMEKTAKATELSLGIVFGIAAILLALI